MVKAKLTYFKGRGKAEVIRLALAVANIELEQEFVYELEDLEKLRQDGKLKFQQMPLLEINGLKLVQSMAVVRYIADNYDLMGKTPEENAMIDMLSDGARDMYDSGFHFATFTSDYEKTKAGALDKSRTRYLPVFEKTLQDTGSGYLVGDKVSMADVVFLDVLLWVQEWDENLLNEFPAVKAFLSKMTSLPSVKAHLEGPNRFPQPTDEYEATVRKILKF
ncbi:glutathione S-transferase alpha-1-like [Amphiura filiformis]|uniref:glutathione S-transferase alpha-1-like n=1 Tax=Amphiura filiformis TaxID=82378 RepID=UPI003B2210B3